MIKSFKFIDTKRFSPVIYGNDLPWKEDYFHINPKIINNDFIKNGDYFIDNEWWLEQRRRCIEGYTVVDAFVEGEGDNYVTERVRYVTDKDEVFYYGGNVIEEDLNTLYFPDLDIRIIDNDVTISGKMYFYLNFWKIKRVNDAKIRKEVLNPLFTDLCFENWCIRERMKKEKLDNLWAKSRQRGLSEEEACDTAWEFLFYNDSQSVIIGGEDKYNENTMRMLKRGLEHLKNTQFYKDLARGGDSISYVMAKNTGSEVYSRTAKDNPEIVSGLSPSKAHLEEIGIFKKGLVKAVAETILPSLEAQEIKTGYITYTSTGGDMEQGVSDAEDMCFKPYKYNLLEFKNIYEDSDDSSTIARFIPAYKFEVIDEDGNSKCKKSIEKLLKERENCSAENRYTKIVMKPLKPSEIFMIKEGGYFGKEISQWCNERKAYIHNHREAQVVKNYNGRWKNPKSPLEGVVFDPHPDGPFLISEMPEVDGDGNVYNNLYKVGTDSYDQDEALTSDSKGACWVKKGFLNANKTYNKYVAGIIERPTTSVGGRVVFYEHTAMLVVAYNTLNLIEHSKILIIEWYKQNNLASLLKLKPEFVTAAMVVNSKTTNKYGIDPATKPHWLTMHKTYLSLKDNIDKCDFIVLLDAWGKFKYDPSGRKYNCDNTIATSLCTVSEEDEKEFEVYSNSQVERTHFRSFTRDERGNIIINN